MHIYTLTTAALAVRSAHQQSCSAAKMASQVDGLVNMCYAVIVYAYTAKRY